MSIEPVTPASAGNWTKWSYYMHTGDEDPQRDYIAELSVRNSGKLLDEANRKAIENAFEKACFFEDGSATKTFTGSSLVGPLDGLTMRIVGDDGELTPVALLWNQLAERYAHYPVIDEELYSELEEQALFDYVKHAVRSCGLVDGHDPEDAADEVLGYLRDHGEDHELENTDDTGGAPSDECITGALFHLGKYTEDNDAALQREKRRKAALEDLRQGLHELGLRANVKATKAVAEAVTKRCGYYYGGVTRDNAAKAIKELGWHKECK